MLKSIAKRLPCGCEIVGVLNGTVCLDHIFAPCPLHAAAPEMLEACKRALDALGEDRTPTDRREAERFIHEIVKKAEGRGI
jgi:hypothetical protein